MSDNIVLSNKTLPKQGWFFSNQATPPMNQALDDALGAMENGARQSNISSLEQALAEVKHEPQSGVSLAEELDHELAVAALLDEISSILDDMNERKLTVTDAVVDVITHSFNDIAQHIDHVLPHVATEVGELGADVCDAIEAHGVSAQPIIAFFNP